MATFLVFLLTGWSGFFIMSLELLGGRMLAPNFGNSIFVWGAVIAVFMTALAIGYRLGGFWSSRRTRRRDLGVMLVLQALATFVCVVNSESIIDWVFGEITDVRYGALTAATLLYFLPTVVSGMVSPYAVGLLVTQARQSGRYAGLLYFVSTFGSAAGTIFTSFYLVLWFDVNQILYGLVAISVCVG